MDFVNVIEKKCKFKKKKKNSLKVIYKYKNIHDKNSKKGNLYSLLILYIYCTYFNYPIFGSLAYSM